MNTLRQNNVQITEKQHIVPVFYLKKFAGKDKLLQVLDLEKRQIAKPRGYRTVCYQHNYYGQKTGEHDEIAESMEELFCAIENDIGHDYDSICDTIRSSRAITDEQISQLSMFMSMLWLRTSTMREQINSMVSKGTQDMLAIMSSFDQFPDHARRVLALEGKSLTNEEIEYLRNFLLEKRYTLTVDNWHHLIMFRHIEEFARMFFIKKWRFYVAGGTSHFATSDTPVVENFPPRESFIGPTIWEREHYLALTPHILVALSDPSQPGKHVKRKAISDSEVLSFNMLRAKLSHRYCYSNRVKEFEEMLTAIGLLMLRQNMKASSV